MASAGNTMLNRPIEGMSMSSQTQDSPIDDELLSSSTGAVIVVPDDMVVGSPLPGWSGRFFHAVNMTFSLWEIAADASDLHSHRHPYEEVWTIIEGEIDLTIDGQVHTLVTGSAAIIPPDVSHAAAVRGACKAYVADHPRRELLPGVLRS